MCPDERINPPSLIRTTLSLAVSLAEETNGFSYYVSCMAMFRLDVAVTKKRDVRTFYLYYSVHYGFART